jgi:hypothetical protein
MAKTSPSVRQRLLGESSVGEDGHHAVAGLAAGDVNTAACDDAGRLEARAERQ